MTTPPVSAPRRYVLGQHETRSLLGRREPGEVAFLVSSVLLGMTASVAAGGSPVGLALLVACVLGAILAVYLPVRGRTLYRWVPLDLRYAFDRQRGRDHYVSGARDAGVLLHSGSKLDVDPPPAVGRLLWLKAEWPSGQLAVVVEPDGALVTCLEVEGPGVGLSDADDQAAAAARWGAMLRDIANGEGLVARLSILERCVPTDPDAHRRYVERFGWVPAPDELISSYEELHAQIGSVSEQHRNFVVARIPQHRDLRAAVRQVGGGDEGLASVASRETTSLAARLEEAGFRVLRALDESRLAALIAHTYAPWRGLDDMAGVDARDAWPRQLTVRAQHVEADGWFHSTAWVKSWPLVPVPVDFLAPLLVQTPGVLRTVVVTFQLLPTDLAMAKVMSDLTADAAHASASSKAGRTADPRDGRQLSQAEQRAADVSSGAAGVRLVGYVTVSAPDEEVLAAARRQVRSAASRSWLALEWCDKEHDTAFVNTLPFARGIQ